MVAILRCRPRPGKDSSEGLSAPASSPRRRAMSSRKRRPSGPTQPETRRKARQRLLRLPPSTGAGPPSGALVGPHRPAGVSALVMADASGSTMAPIRETPTDAD